MKTDFVEIGCTLYLIIFRLILGVFLRFWENYLDDQKITSPK